MLCVGRHAWGQETVAAHHVAAPSVQYLDVGGAARSHPCVPVARLSWKLERGVAVRVSVHRSSWELERGVAVRVSVHRSSWKPERGVAVQVSVDRLAWELERGVAVCVPVDYSTGELEREAVVRMETLMVGAGHSRG